MDSQNLSLYSNPPPHLHVHALDSSVLLLLLRQRTPPTIASSGLFASILKSLFKVSNFSLCSVWLPRKFVWHKKYFEYEILYNFFFYSNFCIIEGPETVQDFVQMQLREIQDNIRSRRNKIFLLMEEVKFFFFFFLMEFFNLVCKNSSTTTFVTTVKLWLLWRKNSGSLWKCESDRYSLQCKIVAAKVATFSL